MWSERMQLFSILLKTCLASEDALSTYIFIAISLCVCMCVWIGMCLYACYYHPYYSDHHLWLWNRAPHTCLQLLLSYLGELITLTTIWPWTSLPTLLIPVPNAPTPDITKRRFRGKLWPIPSHPSHPTDPPTHIVVGEVSASRPVFSWFYRQVESEGDRNCMRQEMVGSENESGRVELLSSLWREEGDGSDGDGDCGGDGGGGACMVGRPGNCLMI